MLTVVAPASTAAATMSTRNAKSVRVASWGENSTSSVNERASSTARTVCWRISSSEACSMYLRWMSEVERKVWMRWRLAGASDLAAASMSPGIARARAAITGGSRRASTAPSEPPGPAAARGALPTCSATAFTASKSPGEAAEKPASITSTFSRASCSAISTFSRASSEMPGDCSPSRSVVSKIVTSGPSIATASRTWSMSTGWPMILLLTAHAVPRPSMSDPRCPPPRRRHLGLGRRRGIKG
jgi:hypothetical protein